MHQDLFLFAYLLLFVTGTLLYSFLARELFRHPKVLPGWPMRGVVVCLAIWYGGCFLDELMGILIPASLEPGAWAALDVLRGFAWLATFPLLTHGIWRLLVNVGLRPSRLWLVPGYVALPLFLPTAWDTLQHGIVAQMEVARAIYPLIVAHVVVGSACSAWMIVNWLRSFREDARLVQFLCWLLGGIGIMVGLVAAGALVAPGSQGEPVWRFAVESSGLILGVTFLYFVQRYNLLRLSLSYRSLRRFLVLLALVGLVMLAGWVSGAAGTQGLRRALAWGLLAALLGAAIYTPLQRAALRRFAGLRRLLGVSITAEELETLTRRLQSLDLSEEDMRTLAAREIGQWLAARARFLPRPESANSLLWDYFADPGARAFNRLDPPAGPLAGLLQKADLQAAFPLRVGGDLAGVLVLEISPAAGGYQEGDMETVQLVLRQLAANLEMRRLVETRLAAERRLAERERLSLLGLVAASLAHELRNPLSSMKSLAQTVHEELAAADPGSDQAQDLGLIVEQIDRLHGVTREILDFARAPEGEGVELTGLLRRTLYVLGHEARRRGIELDASEVRDVGKVGGTPATWQTVLFNLVLNASQHAPAGSVVNVRLSRNGGGVLFATENAGPAIPPEIAGRIFEPFIGDGSGAGLGLALVAQRVRELGGMIEVINEPGRIVFEVRVEKEPDSWGG